MRTYRPLCFNLNTKDPPTDGYEKAGIMFYDGETKWPDRSASGWPIDTGLSACADELYSKLHPVFPWNVGRHPAKEEDGLSVQLRPDPSIFPLALFSIGGETFNPLQIDYSDPIFLRLGYTGAWNPRWVVYPEDYNDTSWVGLINLAGPLGRDRPMSFPEHSSPQCLNLLTFCRYIWSSKADRAVPSVPIPYADNT